MFPTKSLLSLFPMQAYLPGLSFISQAYLPRLFILQAIKAWEISLGDKPGKEASYFFGLVEVSEGHVVDYLRNKRQRVVHWLTNWLFSV